MSTSPQYNFARQAGPSSPPATPTTTAFKRRGIHIPPSPSTIKPTGNGSSFYYTPSAHIAKDLSPRSSSPASSLHSSSSVSSGSPPRSRSTSPAVAPTSESPPRRDARIVTETNFIVEEFADSDYEDWDSGGDEDVIRPHQYEDAESDKAPSVKSIKMNDLDSRILSDFKKLHCEPEDEREIWLEQQRAEKRRRRRSSASVQKRSLAQSIGSGTDDEDLQPVTFEANEAGSSARRLRRKVGDRTSLIFDDPPLARVEEVVECDDDEDSDMDRELRELPYWYVQEMDCDSEE